MEQKGGFNRDAFRNLFEAEEKSFWFTNRNRLIVHYLKKYFPDMESYLEIGCGTGFVLKAVREAFPRCRVSGSELFEEGLVYARERVPDANLIQLDAVNMTACEQYDCFGAFDVLEHIQEDEKVMKNLCAALSCNGQTGGRGGVITVPQHMFMWSAEDDYACHVRRYSQKELRRKLEASGFKVVRMTGFVSLLFPFMMASRLLKKRKNTPPGGKDSPEAHAGDELHLPSWLNAMFSLVMKIEFLLIRLGVSFPFGGSILAVVRKKD